MPPKASGDGMYKLTGIIFVLFLLTTPALAQDLKIEKDGDPDPVRVNGTLVYAVTVTNTGVAAVPGPIVVKDKLPDNVRVLGIVTSDPATCTLNGRDVECSFVGPLASSNTTDDTDEAIVQITVQPTENEDLVNKATVTDVPAGDSNDEAEITTEVKAADRNNPRGNPSRRVNPRRIPNAIRQYQNGETSDLQNAEEDLNDLNDVTNGEDTGQYNDSGNPAATSGNGVPEASTPGAVASANGDEDTSGPVSGPQGDVVNDIPESGPLPNTGGISLLALAMPILGVMLLGVALVARMRK